MFKWLWGQVFKGFKDSPMESHRVNSIISGRNLRNPPLYCTPVLSTCLLYDNSIVGLGKRVAY